MEVNEQKYHQTEGSSDLLNQEFVKLFGHHGEEGLIESVLEGTFQPPNTSSDTTNEFLQACTRPEHVQEIKAAKDPVERFHQFIKEWKCRKEKTASANQHIGHYKASANHPYISWCLFQRHELPSITGYSPQRHRTCIDLSILKTGTITLINKELLGY